MSRAGNWHDENMDERSLSALQAYRPTLRTKWEARLRAAPVTSPLANPDALVHLMEWTLDQLFRELTAMAARRKNSLPARPSCPCGLNPLIAYFATAKVSLHEAMEKCSDGNPINPTDAEEMEYALEIVARRELATFCSLCLHNEHRHRHEPHPHEQKSAHAAKHGKRSPSLVIPPPPPGRRDQAALSP
ncbi:MAG TPA: hypothetical protein VL357_02425 [Rariglobus sp.]|nr:hypothetical protein [Rariglobus sp.]